MVLTKIILSLNPGPKANKRVTKKKLTCRQRCARRCRRFCCNRIKRCFKKKIFGVPDPKLGEYEVAGVDLGELKSKLKLRESATILTLFQRALNIKDSKWNTSIKNIDLIEGLGMNDLKKQFSIKGSKEKVLKNMVNDYKRGRLSLSNIQKSKYDVRNLSKNQLHNMINDYVTAQNEKYADLNADDLKKKFNVQKSQTKVLEKMVDDFKNGKLSATAFSKHGFEPKNLNKEKLNTMLQKYTEDQKLDVTDIKKKFSIKGSKAILLEDFLDDYKKGKTSATRLARKTGFNPTNIKKNDLNNLLNKYEAEQKTKPFLANSLGKFKNLMEDFASLSNIQTIIDNAKKRYQ